MLLPSSLLALLFTILPPAHVAAETVSTNNASLLWGPYRPNLYMEIRPRMADSLIAGLMWGQLEDMENKLRHNVNISAGMARYGWTAYDTRDGGTQTLEDVQNKIDITTEFIKKSDGPGAGNWALRIRGTPRKDAPADLKTAVVFYVGMESMDTCTKCKLVSSEQLGVEEDTSVHAANFWIEHPKLGISGLHIPASVGPNERHEPMVVKSLNVSDDQLWQARSTFLDSLKDQTKNKEGIPTDLMLNNEVGAGNLHFVQMTCHGKFEFDVLYSDHAARQAMTSAELTRELESTVKAFGKTFSHVFGPKTPFQSGQHLAFSEYVLSNLLGGLGYFTGTTQVDTAKKAIYAETTGKFWEKSEEAKKHATPVTKGPFELLTHTPSRAMFPRGFLWDEGFHLLPVLEWDADLALEVLRNWFALMDDDGWIAREQILGAEAKFATPVDFHIQFPHIANPPTMFMVISRFIDLLGGTTKYHGHESWYLTKADAGKLFVAEMYPLLKKHYEWFRKSQAGDVEAHSVPSANLNEGYRWRGRTPETNYASGLDDYPRAEPPDITELHVDALCWVGLMAQVLAKTASFVEQTADASKFVAHVRSVSNNLEELHWEKKQEVYCDTVMRDDVHSYVCHKGYISLFPFLTGFIGADHPHLSAILNLLRDSNHLWTDHGIRSLSPESKKYGVGDNYWRSPIWININYMIIEQLFRLAKTPGPSQQRCREIYMELRSNVVHTVFSAWLQTGYVWEQYDPVGGHGQGTQHFTGWTALVVKIMAMPDLGSGESYKHKVKEYYEEAKKEVVANQKSSGGAAVFAIMLMAFVYVTRRRFAGTLRSMRRNP